MTMTTEERRQWLADRKTGIGGSETAGLLGLNRWVTPMQIWLDKTGRSMSEQEENYHMRRGNILEPVIADGFAKRHPEYTVQEREGLIRHAKYPEIIGTPDRFLLPVSGAAPGILECKAPGLKAIPFWGDDISQIPDSPIVQASQYMLIADVPLGFIGAVLGDDFDGREYPFERDPEMDELIIETIRDFWHNHVLADKEPDLDASDATRKWLDQKFERTTSEVRTITPEEQAYKAITEFMEIDKHLKELTEEHALVQAAIKTLIGESRGVTGDFGKILWSPVKAGESTSWKNVCEAIVAAHPELSGELDQFRGDNTKTKSAYRRFAANWAGED